MSPSSRSVRLDVDRRSGAPAIVRVDAADPVRWAFEFRDVLRSAVTEHGAVLVRGLGLSDAVVAGDVIRQLTTSLMTEREAFAPRTAHSDRLYSSTPWPAFESMFLHNELSYLDRFPGMMLFACLQATVVGGSTVVADSSAVLDALPVELVERCERVGWQLVRNYNDDIGPSWTEAFGVGDRAAVERYCHAHAIEFEWRPGGKLRTRQRRVAVVRHPITGARCWFNQIAFFSEWASGPDVREFLMDDVYGPDELPFTTCFGDGTPISENVVEQVNAVYQAHALREPWQSGDLLLVDNIRAAHGREPFEGAREVLVALADPWRVVDGALISEPAASPALPSVTPQPRQSGNPGDGAAT